MLGSLFSRASELGIDLNISELLVSAEAKVKFYENELVQDRDSQNRDEQERLAETLAEAQRVANEAREAELKQHRKDYSAMVDKGFHKRLAEDNDFLEQLANKHPNSLTEKEEERLTGNYKDTEERKAAEARDKEESDGYKLAYQIRKNAKASIKYRENKIAENLTKLASNPDEQTKKVLEQENKEHVQANKENETDLKNTQDATNERDRKRKQLKKLADQHPPHLLETRVRKHFELHLEDYKEELQENPEHKGLHELHEIVKKVGLDKELIIDKHTSQEQTPATTTKDINTPANLVVHDQETKQEERLSQEVSNPVTETKNISGSANLLVHDQETKQGKQLSQEVLNPVTETKNINSSANLVVHDQGTKQEKQLSQEVSIKAEGIIKTLKQAANKTSSAPPHVKKAINPNMQKFANHYKGIT